ncbi:MAG: GNAT family N-acetyltransferase [Anaerolineae bacterium]|nr:GNAT family N-acetyltransferase [Anaerolineae bacterium]
MFSIQPFDGSDADYVTMTAIDSAVFPQYRMSAEEWKHIDANRDPKYPFHRDLIACGDSVVAFGDYGQLPRFFHPQKYVFNIFVHPDHDHPDIRPFYLRHVLDVLKDHNLIAVTTGMLADKTTHMNFLVANGFEETMREPMSELDITTFDPARFAHVNARVESSSIKIVSLTELQKRDPDWKRHLYDVRMAIIQDVPTTGTQVLPSFEEFESSTLCGPAYDTDGWFVALENSHYVGMCRGWMNQADAEKFNNELTGVIRSHRRRGIATALKLRLIAYARQRGVTIITTSNEENNPMYHLNLMLGFVAKPAWVHYEKTLQDA